jgi:hypothetical protein
MTHAHSPQGKFSNSESKIEKLVRQQGIEPFTDPSTLVGRWPGDRDDGFEELIDRLRRQEFEDRTDS